MKLALVIITSLLFLVSPLSEAAKPKKQPQRWRKHNGEIVLDSVCDDFAYGSLDYRECRASMQFLFEDRCREYRVAADRAGGTRRESLQQKRDMYCTAASQFSAVN